MALALKRIFGNNIHAVKRAFPCTILSQKRFLPICTVSTNLAENKIPDKFGEELVDLIADVLSKPKNLVSVSVDTDVKMWRGLNAQPTALVNIWSIGVFDPKRNEVYSLKFFKFFTEKLKLPDDRIALIFHPIELEQAGHLTYFRLKESK